MSDMYNTIDNLCKKRGVNITQMCREAGIPRAVISELKMGRTNTLSPKNLEKLSSYFNVTVDSILGKEQKKETPTPKSERDIENEEIIKKLESDEALRAAVLRFLGM